MTFGGEVKNELCRLEVHKKCCAQAEAYGVLLYCNTFSGDEVRFSGDEVRIVTEHEAFAQRLPVLFKKAFRLTFDRLPQGEGKYIFSIQDPGKLEIIHQTYGSDRTALALHINFAVLEEDCCRASFLRGAFLAGGSVTDPRKGYHLELATSHHSVSREMLALMREEDFSPKDAQRKGNSVIYFKQSESIENFLTAVGAPLSAMEVMNAKLEKDLRGSVNRRRQPGQGGGGRPGPAGGHPAAGAGQGAGEAAGQAPGGRPPADGPPGGHPVPAGGALRPAGDQVCAEPPPAQAGGIGTDA